MQLPPSVFRAFAIVAVVLLGPARALADPPSDEEALRVHRALLRWMEPAAIDAARSQAAALASKGWRRLDFDAKTYAVDASGDRPRIDVHVSAYPAYVFHAFDGAPSFKHVMTYMDTPEGRLEWKPGRTRFSFFVGSEQFHYTVRGGRPRLLGKR